jgi:hypothetical protein
MTVYADRAKIESSVKAVLKKYQTATNDQALRNRIVHELYQTIPVGPAFQIICDTYNNGQEQISAGQICVDVYFNDEQDNLYCMEFVSDPNRELTLEDAIKLHEAVRGNEKPA